MPHRWRSGLPASPRQGGAPFGPSFRSVGFRPLFSRAMIRSCHIDIQGGVIAHVQPAEQARVTIDGAEFPVPRGACILPGLVDTHCHLIGLGMMASRVSLHGAGSPMECAQRVAEHARRLPHGTWIEGFGWNQEEWEGGGWPDRSILDALVPDHPVVLQRVDTHASWINSRAIILAGIMPGNVPGGEIVIDGEGRPTGILVDSATRLVERAMPEPSNRQKRDWIERSIAEAVRLGITEVHDMNVELARVESMVNVSEGGGMLLRCRVFLAGMEGEWTIIPAPTPLGPNLDTVGVKYFADGALGSRGALLLEPYSDAPTHGLCLLSRAELLEKGARAASAGYAVSTHAIGDGANRLVLDAYERLRSDNPDALLRIEHAQVVHQDDLDRFQRLGVLPVVQPIHCVSDAAMAEARLGVERCREAYRWRSLRETGCPLLGGSDFPIESPDPRAGMRAFVERRPPGRPRAWFGHERISRDDAIRAYTEWAPLGVPGTPSRGRLAPGYDADLVVFDGDPFDRGEVAATFVGGMPVFRRDE